MFGKILAVIVVLILIVAYIGARTLFGGFKSATGSGKKGSEHMAAARLQRSDFEGLQGMP